MTRRSEKSGPPADLASKPGSLQLPPNVSHKTLERLRNWIEVLELVTGKVEICSYNCLTPEPSVFQLGPVDQTLSTALPRAEGLGPHPTSGLNRLVLMLPRAGRWRSWGGGIAGPIWTWAEKRAGPGRPPSPSPMAHMGKLKPREQRGLAKVIEQTRKYRGWAAQN